MNLISLEVLLILLLILASGAFSMAEMAVVSARKTRLQQQAEDGNKNAKRVLELAGNTKEFLSTVQVGITVIGTLTGAFSGVTIAKQLTVVLQGYPAVPDTPRPSPSPRWCWPSVT